MMVINILSFASLCGKMHGADLYSFQFLSCTYDNGGFMEGQSQHPRPRTSPNNKTSMLGASGQNNQTLNILINIPQRKQLQRVLLNNQIWGLLLYFLRVASRWLDLPTVSDDGCQIKIVLNQLWINMRGIISIYQIMPKTSERPGNRPSVFLNFHVHCDFRLVENLAFVCHMFISWWCLLALHFHGDLWNIFVSLQWEFKNACWTPSKNITFFGLFCASPRDSFPSHQLVDRLCSEYHTHQHFDVRIAIAKPWHMSWTLDFG